MHSIWKVLNAHIWQVADFAWLIELYNTKQTLPGNKPWEVHCTHYEYPLILDANIVTLRLNVLATKLACRLYAIASMTCRPTTNGEGEKGMEQIRVWM